MFGASLECIIIGWIILKIKLFGVRISRFLNLVLQILGMYLYIKFLQDIKTTDTVIKYILNTKENSSIVLFGAIFMSIMFAVINMFIGRNKNNTYVCEIPAGSYTVLAEPYGSGDEGVKKYIVWGTMKIPVLNTKIFKGEALKITYITTAKGISVTDLKQYRLMSIVDILRWVTMHSVFIVTLLPLCIEVKESYAIPAVIALIAWIFHITTLTYYEKHKIIFGIIDMIIIFTYIISMLRAMLIIL